MNIKCSEDVEDFRGKTLAFTGHRPSKLGGFDPSNLNKLQDFAVKTLEILEPKRTVLGMALGWDQAVAKASLLLGIPFEARIPFQNFHVRWPNHSVKEYMQLMNMAESTHIVSEGDYTPWKLQLRNESLVDHSEGLVALFDGSPSGTHNCIEYASKKLRKIPIMNLWPVWEQWK